MTQPLALSDDTCIVGSGLLNTLGGASGLPSGGTSGIGHVRLEAFIFRFVA